MVASGRRRKSSSVRTVTIGAVRSTSAIVPRSAVTVVSLWNGASPSTTRMGSVAAASPSKRSRRPWNARAVTSSQYEPDGGALTPNVPSAAVSTSASGAPPAVRTVTCAPATAPPDWSTTTPW